MALPKMVWFKTLSDLHNIPEKSLDLVFPRFLRGGNPGQTKVKKQVAQVYSASQLQSEKRKSSVLKPHHLGWLASGISLSPYSQLSGFTLDHFDF